MNCSYTGPAGLATAGLEHRTLHLKGKTEPVDAFVLHEWDQVHLGEAA